jgi:hydrogenase maturation protease
VSPFDEHACWIVGYGNRERRDDGVGPILVERLKRFFGPAKGVDFLAVPQLTADLVEVLKNAARILFIDAALDDAAHPRSWCRVVPDARRLPCMTHHVQPSHLLGLLEMLYRRSVFAWLISVRGSDFDYGEGLSPKAARAAAEVEQEVIAFVSRTTPNSLWINDGKKGAPHGKHSRYPNYRR